MPGVPASVTSATDSPAASRPTIRSTRALLVVLVHAEERRLDAEVAKQDAGAARVFGGDELDLLAGPCRARSVMSSRLPIGVATT